MDREDLILAKLAVERGWLKPEQVDECVREQSDDKDETVGRNKLRPLGVILVSRRYLTDQQLIQLMGEAKKLASAAAEATPGYKMLGQILVGRRVVMDAQVDEALAAQKKETSGGRKRRIGEILVEKGYAKRDDVIRALRDQDKTIMSCTGCGTRFNVVAYKPWIEYRCKKCKAPLEMAAEMITAADSTGTMRAIRDDEVPEEVKEATKRPMVLFGKYILVKEILKGPFGTLIKSWQKDAGRYVGIVFLESKDSQVVARIFSQVQQALRAVGTASSSVIEVGQQQGRCYMCVSLAQPATA